MKKNYIIEQLVNKFNSEFTAYTTMDSDNFFCPKERFITFIRNDLNLMLGDVYHAYGVGANNEFMIYKSDIDEDGFEIRKNVCKFEYIYGNPSIFTAIKDIDGKVLCQAGTI